MKTDQIKNAYSYIRLSSKKQTDADKSGIDRQLDNFKIVCERYGWMPQTQTFKDLGVSGYDGSNFQGQLGEFMKLAKDGKLAENPVLVIESLDRFSRQDIDSSEPAVINLLKAGVALHIKFTSQTFTKASTVELGDRIVIMVALKSAYTYSQQLSERIKAAKDRKLIKLGKGESVNICDYAPRWISWKAGKLVLNDNADAVRIIFKEYTSNKSLSAICRVLHNNNIKTFHNGNWTKQTGP